MYLRCTMYNVQEVRTESIKCNVIFENSGCGNLLNMKFHLYIHALYSYTIKPCLIKPCYLASNTICCKGESVEGGHASLPHIIPVHIIYYICQMV